MTTSNAYSFTRTGRTWGVLLLTAIAWLIVSLWAYRVAATQVEQADAQASEQVSKQADEQARLVAERTAQQQASEAAQRKAAAREAARKEAEEQQILEKEAAEQARLIAQQRAEEQAQQAAQERAQAEAAMEDSEQLDPERQMAAQEAKRAARLALERQNRLRAQNNAALQVAELTVASEPQESQTEQEAQVSLEAENAREAAAEEARRVARNAARILAYENLRKEETGVLEELSETLQFQSRSEVIDSEIERSLDSVFEPLFLYPEMPVVVTVSTNEFQDPADNSRLSSERAQAVVAYLVGRGLQPERFDIQVDPGEGLPYGSHRVRVSVEDPIQ